jgi:hypothetical protein
MLCARLMHENAVAQAIKRLGGLTAAVVKTGYSANSLARWRIAGKVPRLVAAVRLEELTGISVRALAGLDNGSAPGGGSPRKKRQNAGKGRARGGLRAVVERVHGGQQRRAESRASPVRLSTGT